MSCDCELDLKNYVTVDYPSDKLLVLAQKAYDNAKKQCKELYDESDNDKDKACKKYDDLSWFMKLLMDDPSKTWSCLNGASSMLGKANDFKKIIDLCRVTDTVRISGDALKRLTDWAE